MSALKAIIRYMRYPDGRPWGCIYLLDADHIGWTVQNPADRWNKKLARDGGTVWKYWWNGKQLNQEVSYLVKGAKERAEECRFIDLNFIDQIPRIQYVPGQWRRRAIEREVFLMRAWAKAREGKA